MSRTRLDQLWDQLFPPEQQRIVRLLMIEKVIVSPDDIEVERRARIPSTRPKSSDRRDSDRTQLRGRRSSPPPRGA
ncbi:MAG: hypothetical protein ACREWE_07930 [Gammaproteobacteria bacterium]